MRLCVRRADCLQASGFYPKPFYPVIREPSSRRRQFRERNERRPFCLAKILERHGSPRRSGTTGVYRMERR